MRQRLVSTCGGERGFTLVEVMVAATVLIVGVLGTFTLVEGAQRTTRENNARTVGSGLAREILEHARTLDYEQIAPATLVGQLRTKSTLTGTTGATGEWVVRRRNIPITVRPTVCTYDDAKDGVAATPPANACVAGSATTVQDSNPDDFRRVTLSMSWSLNGATHSMTHTGQIVNPGGGLGPRITVFNDYNGGVQVTDPNLTAIPMAATSTLASNVRWSVDDGVTADDALGGPMNWTWDWTIGTVGTGSWVVDGAYTFNAQPFDDRGIPGEMRVASVLLNRRPPLAPSGVAGGRSDHDGGVAEIEWSRNLERDILGYRVYREDESDSDSTTTEWARVCPASGATTPAVIKRTSCTDTGVPESGAVRYRVYAVDLTDVGNPTSLPREGDFSELVTASSAGPRPLPPVMVSALIEDGRVRLQWVASASADVGFYRIYRDGVRYDRTITAASEYVDADPGSSTVHTYRVSAVVTSPSGVYNESILSNEVISP